MRNSLLPFVLVLSSLFLAAASWGQPEAAGSRAPDLGAAAPLVTRSAESQAVNDVGSRAARTPPHKTLSVEQALQLLEVNNLDVIASRARAAEAAARVRQANAALRPKLVAVGSYVRNNQEVSVGLGALSGAFPGAPNVPNIVIQPLDAWTATGSLKLPLFAPTAWYDSNAAEAATSAEVATTEVVRQRARATLLQLAYGASALEEVVAAAERAIELSSRQVRSAERRVAAGTAAPLDALRARTDLVQRQSDLAAAEADLERLQLSLGLLLGEAEAMRIAVPAVEPAATTNAAELESAMEQRAEFEVIEARTRAAEALRSSARARLLPELAATGAVFASDEPYPTGDKTGWRVAVELTLPLYDGGFRYGKRDEAEALLSQARNEATRQRLAVQQEVKLAQREVALGAERLRLAESKVALARDAAASAERAFAVGVTSSLDVLDANDKLFQAEVALAAERSRIGRANVELRRALGTL